MMRDWIINYSCKMFLTDSSATFFEFFFEFCLYNNKYEFVPVVDQHNNIFYGLAIIEANQQIVCNIIDSTNNCLS